MEKAPRPSPPCDKPGPVTFLQIEADGDVEILDQQVYLATVSDGGRLQMEMRLKHGRGYVSAEKNFDEDWPWLHPHRFGAFAGPQGQLQVEAARLGQMTDYDKLTLEVWTNGSITPQDAVGLARSCSRTI